MPHFQAFRGGTSCSSLLSEFQNLLCLNFEHLVCPCHNFSATVLFFITIISFPSHRHVNAVLLEIVYHDRASTVDLLSTFFQTDNNIGRIAWT